jgi:signal transduction histidine kinase
MTRSIQEDLAVEQHVDHDAQRTTHLFHMTAALSRALTPQAVATVALDYSLSAVNGCYGVLMQINPSGIALTTLAISDQSNHEQSYLDERALTRTDPLTDAVRRREQIWLTSRSTLTERYPQLLHEPSGYDLQSYVALPMMLVDHVLGVIGIGFDHEHCFDAGERTCLMTIAHVATQALERARLMATEHALLASSDEALALLDEAVRLRDTFLSVAAHELKTPLTALLGQSQLLRHRLQKTSVLTEANARSIDIIIGQTRRFNDLLDDLLDGARLESGQLMIRKMPFEVVELLRAIVDELQPTLSGHHLHVELPVVQLLVMGDRLRMGQVLHNLLGNAVKYSPQGGTIQLRTAVVGDSIQIVVADEGIGIAPEALPHVFKRFYRAPGADRVRPDGIGIGLYVVREIVHQHGGTVHVASALGAGSTFMISLPLMDER